MHRMYNGNCRSLLRISHHIVFLTEIVACGTAEECKAACGIEAGCSNFAYVSMVIGIMPTGKCRGNVSLSCLVGTCLRKSRFRINLINLSAQMHYKVGYVAASHTKNEV